MLQMKYKKSKFKQIAIGLFILFSFQISAQNFYELIKEDTLQRHKVLEAKKTNILRY